MADAISYIQIDPSGVDPGSIVFNTNGDISYPALHRALFPGAISLSILEMRLTLQSGNSATFLNNVPNWTSCDSLTWPLCRSVATRAATSNGTTNEAHTVLLEVRRKNWTADGVSGTFTLNNSAIVQASPLGNQSWTSWLILEGMIEGTSYFAYVEYGFGTDGTLYKKRFGRQGGSNILTNQTILDTWNAGISPSDLEIKVVDVGNAEGLFTNDFSDWVSGDNGGSIRVSGTANSAEPQSYVRNVDVYIRQKSQPTNVGITNVELTVSLVF